MLVLASVLVPTVSLAQPAPPPPPPPPGGGAPAYGAPAYGAQQDPWFFHQGMTFEANLGVGYVHLGESYMGQSVTTDTDAALAGADVGIGGWLNPQLAVTLRITGVQVKYTQMGMTYPTDGNLVHAMIGPNVQYWVSPNIWLGGGVGGSTFRLVGSNSCTGDQCGTNGFGFNLRAGYSFGSGGPHVFNISVESNTGFYSQSDGMGGSIDVTATGLAVLAGYQYL